MVVSLVIKASRPGDVRGPRLDSGGWQSEGAWQSDAACRNKDETLFFHPPGERGATRRRRDAVAKAICSTCPVIRQCREQSLLVREPYGVWGGLSEDERAAILAEPVQHAI